MTAGPELWSVLVKGHCSVRVRLGDSVASLPPLPIWGYPWETVGKLFLGKGQVRHGELSGHCCWATVSVQVSAAGSTDSSISQLEAFFSSVLCGHFPSVARSGLVCYLKRASSHRSDSSRNKQVQLTLCGFLRGVC